MKVCTLILLVIILILVILYIKISSLNVKVKDNTPYTSYRFTLYYGGADYYNESLHKLAKIRKCPLYVIGIGVFLITIVYLSLKRIELSVTSSKIIGKSFLFNKVNILCDDIIVIKYKPLSSLKIYTRFGNYLFPCMNDVGEVYTEIEYKIKESRIINGYNEYADSLNKKPNIIDTNISTAISKAESLDVLIKYKELLDKGIITLDEYEKKKKETL